MKTIKIDNEVYVAQKDIKGKIVPTKKQIVILNRGWVVVGDYSEKGDECTLTNASVIRKWGTTQGIGELAEKGKLPDTILDATPDVHFLKLTMVARIDVNETNWQ